MNGGTRASFEFQSPDHFTAGTIGPAGQREFYLQSRESGRIVTLKVEKEQVRALGDYLAGLLSQLPEGAGPLPRNLALVEPITAAWAVGAIAVGYDKAKDRIVVEMEEVADEEEEARESATARLLVTRAQAAAFVERSRQLMKAGRPICPMCSQPKDPDGHFCPRANGHARMST